MGYIAVGIICFIIGTFVGICMLALCSINKYKEEDYEDRECSSIEKDE